MSSRPFFVFNEDEEKERRRGKREPVEPAVLAPCFEMPFRRRYFLLEAEKKVPKETAFSSLAADRSSRESDQSGSAPSHERSRLFLPVECPFKKTYRATPPEPPPPLCQLLSLERLNAWGNELTLVFRNPKD
jgi:hypothetical protein